MVFVVVLPAPCLVENPTPLKMLQDGTEEAGDEMPAEVVWIERNYDNAEASFSSLDIVFVEVEEVTNYVDETTGTGGEKRKHCQWPNSTCC